MRIRLLFFVLAILFVGCGSNEESSILPTRAESALNGPRAIPGAPTPGLPATWTPSPIQINATPIPAVDTSGGGSNESSAEENQRTHVVKAGDTLGEIAQQYGVSLSDLVAANDIDNIDVIEVGTVLIIPGG